MGKEKALLILNLSLGLMQRNTWKKSRGQKLMDDVFHSTVLERKNKGKRKLGRIALGVVNRKLFLSNRSYNATKETLEEVFEKATFIKVPQNPHGKPKG